MSNNGWYIDNGASSHMIGVRLMLLSVSEINSNYCVSCDMQTRHEVREFGSMVLYLESGGSLEVVGVMYVLGMSISLLLV